MKTTSRLMTALAVSIVLVGPLSLGASVQAVAQQKQTVSKAVAKPLKAAQDAMNAKKYQEALARLKEVQAVPNKTPYDEFILNEMLGFVSVRTNNYQEAARALEAGLNSGFLDQAEVPNRVRALAQVNYQIKNYPKAIEFGERAIRAGQADEDMYTLVGQAYYIRNDYKGTLRFMNNYVDSEIKRGRTPKEQSLQLVLSSCVKLDDAECTTSALERMVAYYPKPEYWQQLVYNLFQTGEATDRSMLHVYRLANEVDVLRRPEDYTEMAQLALEQGSPGEAQRILEKGFAKNVFEEQRQRDRNQRLLESAKKAAANDQAALPKIEKDAASSKTGDRDVGLGLAYFSYEQYDKAAEAISRGLSKGGVRNEAEARLLLGIAQLKAGNKNEAVKGFAAVKGDPKLERIANLWQLHARQA